jgi:sulfur carrier protein ThiS
VSNDAGPETLPLSAPTPALLPLVLDIGRAQPEPPRELWVVPGSTVRAALRSIGLAPEGSAVLDGETPLPLDTPIDRPRRLTVVSTFSGG